MGRWRETARTFSVLLALALGVFAVVLLAFGKNPLRAYRDILSSALGSVYENILGNLGDDFLTIAPFGPAVPADVARIVNAKKQEFTAGTAHPFTGPLKDNRGVERVKAGETFPLTQLGKMDWLVEGVVGQPR